MLTRLFKKLFISPLLHIILFFSTPLFRFISVMNILNHFTQAVDFVTESHAPLDTDAACPESDESFKKVSETLELWSHPAVKISDLPAFWDAVKHGNTIGLDDRKLLLEKVLVLMARYKNSDRSMQIQRYVIDLLYKDLPHPPRSYLCPPTGGSAVVTNSLGNIKYAFRTADGSNYNPLFPSLGKAGSPYARSVPGLRFVPKHVLPDPGLVFDTLLRREEFVPHPGGISSLFFAFADLVIHSIFNTNHTDWTKNDTSSYLDLSILYGNSESQVNQVRRKDGTGRLWEDVFADSRLLFMPPASCALLVLLSRNHNYIAQKLLNINENGTFVFPVPQDEQARLAQDDEIFNRARMVNCGFFLQIILGDYVGAILGLIRDRSDWRLDPLMSMRESDHEVSPQGKGNVVSVEFNLLYRWHSTLSAQDAEWTTNTFSKLFEGRDSSQITVQDFKLAAHKYLIPHTDVRTWEFNGLKREPDGRFKDDDLARTIQDATEHRAGAFKARGTPEALRIIEILGIEQGRAWGTCSLNEFRKFLGLKPYKTFKEWNPDEKIHTAAAALYKDIENLELHVGLQAEETKVPGPGAGLCPGYTISRAILADAVSLTRGDPFFTTEFTPFNLTSWGYEDCQYDTKDGSHGGILTKLLFRTLPDHYPAGSAYAHFPFLDPVYMREILTKDVNLVNKYTWTRPQLPSVTGVINSFNGVKQVLSDPSFVSAYNDRILDIITTPPTADKEDHKLTILHKTRSDFVKGRKNVESLLPYSEPPHETWAGYFTKEVKALITEKAVHHIGDNSKYVDIVGDVINLVPVRWVSEKILGLPLKTISNPSGTFYEQEMYKMFANTARYVFLNIDPAHDWHLRESSVEAFRKILNVTEAHLGWVTPTEILDHIAIKNYDSHRFLKRVREAGTDYTTKELAAQVFSAVVPTAALFSQVIAHVVDFYLDDDKRNEREEIVKLVSACHDKETVAKIMVYVQEALRLNPTVSGVYRTAGKDVSIEHSRVQAGQRIFASIVNANVDTSRFGATPTTATYDKPDNAAGIFGFGEYGLLSAQFFESTAPTILGTVLGLKNLKRAPGQSGRFARFTEELHGSPQQWYINMQGKTTPFPDSLVVQFD
uniref:Dioxygenase n=1 Tax=Tricholoma matsutake TaxID=40145 RepID=A0A7G1PUP4_TRIMT